MTRTARTFTIPAGFKPEMVAEIFSAYLHGHETHDNIRVEGTQPRRLGPWRKTRWGGVEYWQLDAADTIIFEMDGTHGVIYHDNNDEHAKLCQVMLDLYLHRYQQTLIDDLVTI